MLLSLDNFEHLAAENEILRSKIEGRIKFTDAERIRLAKLGHELGCKAFEDVADCPVPAISTGIPHASLPAHTPP
jgi:hypothetical protein